MLAMISTKKYEAGSDPKVAATGSMYRPVYVCSVLLQKGKGNYEKMEKEFFVNTYYYYII